MNSTQTLSVQNFDVFFNVIKMSSLTKHFTNKILLLVMEDLEGGGNGVTGK